MDWNRIEGNWKQLKGKVKVKVKVKVKEQEQEQWG